MWKTFTFAILHFFITFSIAFALTGDTLTGGLIALLEPACNTVAYYFHEKFWKRIEKSKEDQIATVQGRATMAAF